jgi:hypothetical protein
LGPCSAVGLWSLTPAIPATGHLGGCEPPATATANASTKRAPLRPATPNPICSDQQELAGVATEQAASLRALRPKASAHAQQTAALPPLRARVGELQQQVAAVEAEVRGFRGVEGGKAFAVECA